MKVQSITKTFDFDMGHRLSNYSGKCRRLHGHSYHLEVEVENITYLLNDMGMVMDFGILKDIVKTRLLDEIDHKMMLKIGDPVNEALAKALQDNEQTDHIVWVEFNPTAENMVVWMKDRIEPHLDGKLRIRRIKLYETPTSFAEVKEV